MNDTTRVVRIGNASDASMELLDSKRDLPDNVAEALDLAEELTPVAASVGRGGTIALWEALATLSAHDLGVARTVEPHLDAVAILAQAGHENPRGVWGVFAAEGRPAPLRATLGEQGWVLDGVKPWCSLAGRLDHALVTAHLSDGERQLFSVDLRQAGVEPETGTWQARGLAEIPSSSVSFSRVPAKPIGEPGWYLSRPGFWWGGIGVAACWYGGAAGVARTVFSAASATQGPHALAHLGAIDTLLHACRVALQDAARRVDDPEYPDGPLLAKRVRGLVSRSCEEIMLRAGHVTGPGPLTSDLQHAKQVTDLHLYIRQHHAERDDASLGNILVTSGNAPW